MARLHPWGAVTTPTGAAGPPGERDRGSPTFAPVWANPTPLLAQQGSDGVLQVVQVGCERGAVHVGESGLDSDALRIGKEGRIFHDLADHSREAIHNLLRRAG